MFGIISDLAFLIVKPIMSEVLRKKNYPSESIEKKYGNILDTDFSKDNNVIMFHGVSVGEINALEALVKEAHKRFPNCKIVVTTGTYTGQDLAKKKFAEIADYITYFPADFPCCINKFLKTINPQKVFIAETEIWPNFVMLCRKNNIKCYIINGRISDSTFKSYYVFKFIFKYILSFYDGIYTQSEEDNEKFLKLGANPLTTKKMNNLKFDIKKPEVNFEIDKANSTVMLAGSTHKGEDEQVLYTYKKLKELHVDLKLIIAPRHLTRVDEVKAVIDAYSFKYGLRSEGVADFSAIDVLILDTLGELGKMYAFTDLSFIGGSFNNTGGHNPLESIVFGKPVISGMSIHNFKDIYSIITKAGAGFLVENKEEFYNVANRLLSDKAFYERTANSCSKVFEEQQGALEFVLKILEQ
ncbi:MAG: 3-deoxy-D-manno-octulosonic acid transferase [bacterium]|nr:3-deoxy-D-manno-octulosonic acid transferase [bacterium]